MACAAGECYFRDETVKTGLDALLIGVSNYPFIRASGLRDLSGPSLSVVQLADWLVANKGSLSFPLKSVRLLASPLPEEIELQPQLGKVPSAVLANVAAAAKHWQRDAATSRDGTTMFYFAGHGIQRSKGDAVLLLQDFLDAEASTDLERTISVNNIYNGMANFVAYPSLARTQCYFIDACRSDLDELKLRDFEMQEPSALFKVERGGVDDRSAPIFFAAAAGMRAWNARGTGTLFWQDLHACLEGMGAELLSLKDGSEGWFVTVSKLNDSLCRMVNQFNAGRGMALRSFNLDKFDPRALLTTIRRLEQPPKVPCTIELAPAEAIPDFTVTFDLPDVEVPAPLPLQGARLSFQKQAGYYWIKAQANPSCSAQYRGCAPVLKPVLPPSFRFLLRLG